MNKEKEIEDILREILKWTKFQGWQKAKDILEAVLDNDQKKLIYEMSDGKSSREIAKIVKLSDQTIRNYWKDWSVIGIVEPFLGYKKRFQRVFSLMDFGIPIPEIESNEKETEKIEVEKNE